MVTWIERDSNSDLSPTWNSTTIFDKDMIAGTGGGSSFSVTVPSLTQRSGGFITISGIPNNDAMPDGGTQTVELEIVSGGGMNLTARCRIVRLDSAGNVEESGAFTGTQTTQSSRVFSPVSPTWGSGGDAEACSDRVAIEFEFDNVDTMMNITVEIGTGATENEVITDIPLDGGTCGGAVTVKFINQGGEDLD